MKKCEDTAQFIDIRSRKLKQDGRHGFQETSKVTFFNYTRKRRRAKDNVASIRSGKRELLEAGSQRAGAPVSTLQSKREESKTGGREVGMEGKNPKIVPLG